MQRAVLRPSSRSINPSFGRAGRGERKRGREDAKNGTDVRSSSVPVFASLVLQSIQRVFGTVFQGTRSRSVSYRDDCLLLLHVILARFRPGSCFLVLSRADPVQAHHGMTLNRSILGQALLRNLICVRSTE